jgi:carbamoylphosphate synthase large subunit
MSTILVTGIGGPAGRSVTSLLLERGYRVVGTDMAALSPDGVTFYQVPAADDPGLLPMILKISRKEKVDLIIPTVTEELLVFSSQWLWSDEFPVMVAPANGVAIANDKYSTSKALVEQGVPIPRFILPSQVKSPSDVEAAIGWPCISKPRIGRGGREVSLHAEADWPQVSALSDRYILQEFASGVDLAPNLYVDPAGKDSVVVVLEKTELKEGIVGNAKSVKRVEAKDVAYLALHAALASGLNGPLDIDIRRREDGSPVVLEINARFGANIRSAPEVLEAALKKAL